MIDLPDGKIWLPPKPAIIRPADADLLRYGRDPALAHILAPVAAWPAGGGGAATVSHTAAATNITNGTSWTFSSQSIGTAAGNRYVVVAAGWDATTNPTTASSITVGGTGLTEIIEDWGWNSSFSFGQGCAIYAGLITSGTSADIVLTVSASAAAAGIQVYAVYGNSGAAGTPQSSAGTAKNPSVSMDCAAGAVLVAVSSEWAGNGTGGPVAWTGLTEDDETTAASPDNEFAISGASDAFASAQSGLTVQATWTADASIDAVALCCSEFR